MLFSEAQPYERLVRGDHNITLITPVWCSLEHLADITKAHSVLPKSEGSVISHFLGGSKKGAKRYSREDASDAYALHSDLRKFSEAQANTRESHQNIHRAIE